MSNETVQPSDKVEDPPASSSLGGDDLPAPSTAETIWSPENLISSESIMMASEITVTTSGYDLPLNMTEEDFEKEMYNYLKPKFLKRKKVFTEIPEACVTLGKIPFSSYSDEFNDTVPENVQASLIVYDETDGIEVFLEVSTSKVCKKYATLESVNNIHKSIICDLLSRNYLWILEDLDGLRKGLVDVTIAFLAEKAPILKAQGVMEIFTERTFPNYNVKLGKNVGSIETFLEEMQFFQKKNMFLPNVSVQHRKLKPTLCPYQAKAVRWMLKREQATLQPQNSDWKQSVIERFNSPGGAAINYNIYSQSIFLGLLEFPPFPRGGILADEMGLGKTVAVIALILNNPRSLNYETDTGEFLIPLPETNIRKASPKKLKSQDMDSEDTSENQNREEHLTPHEELVLSKARKGTAMKRALNKWYESTLAEYSASTPSKIRRTSKNLIKCLCGDASSEKDDRFIECRVCKRFQHATCVGFQESYPYFCPLCWSNQKPVKSNATLIISPSNIYYQWLEEINKHVAEKTFMKGVFMYDDMKCKFIQPFALASYDIVICTYSRLKAELNHAIKVESSRKLRNEERFLKQCSPLTQVNWWRLCLDEAQMVEADSSAMSQMAKLIPAVNRWSVTGTPIQKSINDMYHLVDFLRIEPFTDKYLWDTLLYTPYIHGNKFPLCSTVSQIFWRNSKEDVSDEMFIPEQKVRYHFLKFTAVEQNFYMREHATSSNEFAECLRRSELDVTTTIDSLDKTTLTRLLNPLLNLRQACSHPLAVKGNKISTKTGSMTMTDLFKYLHNKTKVECEEELRKYISALNGMAGILCIREEWINAVEYYRKVLQINEEYKEKVHVDSLQRIHTLTNLAEVLAFHGENVGPTLRDDSLKDEAKQLENKYMGKVLDEFRAHQKVMIELSAKVKDLENSFSSNSEVWWARLITTLMAHDAIEEVIDKVSAELLANQTDNKKNVETFLSKISSPKLIEVLLMGWLKSVKDNRRKVMRRLDSLIQMSCDNLVSQAVDCHLRTTSSPLKKTKCGLCVCENELLDYECCLFAVSRKILKEEYEKILDGAQTKGSWKAHKAERVLRVILSVARNKSSTERWALMDGRKHMNLLDAMKKEFKQLRVMWMSLNHQVQARDEVNMCKVRLRLRLPGEPLPPKPAKLNLKEQNKVETIYIIQHHEVDAQQLKLTGEIEISKSEFHKKYGTLLYLDNVGKKENATPEPCPVCKTVLENEWCVLQCGHSYCIECIRILLMRNCKPSINCPVCREVTKSCNLSFIDLSGREENSDIKVVGEHSTKIEAVVRTLLELKRKNKNVKVLVFSTWAIVLKVLVVALEENGISFRRMPGHNYQTHLKEFKDPKLNITALLLPISWGSKGLNLIEATHVFLVEPIMNPAEELQALGRVHRIGQHKETVVHRFLMKGTIEEKIYSAVSEAKDKWDKKKVTLGDLKNLFDIKQNLVKSSGQLPPEYAN